jgi:hypothetical protein
MVPMKAPTISHDEHAIHARIVPIGGLLIQCIGYIKDEVHQVREAVTSERKYDQQSLTNSRSIERTMESGTSFFRRDSLEICWGKCSSLRS